jgi:CO dehydrogenase/acetyl-CoA synthase alpha subunit
MAPVLIVWGALPERMQAIVAAWARAGSVVIIGPDSGFGWKRYLLGNKWQWEKWWAYDTFERGKKYITEPSPKHLIIPVETKEEVAAIVHSLIRKPVECREARLQGIYNYLELYDVEFGELPDDWPLITRSDWELPPTRKLPLLKVLKEKWGWDIQRMTIKKARHVDGRMLDPVEYTKEYGGATSKQVTKLPRLVARDIETFRKKEG